jgi:hypothetical protein
MSGLGKRRRDNRRRFSSDSRRADTAFFRNRSRARRLAGPREEFFWSLALDGAALTQLRHNMAIPRTVDVKAQIRPVRGPKRENDMRIMTAKTAAAMLILGVALGGCATRESVETAQNAANAADRHAGTAQARADEAYGVGNNALGVGTNALSVGNGAASAAQLANDKSDLNANDVQRLKRKVAYLEWKVLPHHKKHRRPHSAARAQLKSSNS